MTNLPDRQFYLIGDSGELDPEAYAEIRSQDRFSKRVKEVRIRDVVNAAVNDPQRLKDMIVRHAPTIVHGRSQFDSWTSPTRSQP
jgi:phosphatidate phosphatase APP1